MKVLFVVTAFPRHEADIITPWMGETIRRLKRAGTEVEVLAPSYRGSVSGLVGELRVHRFRYGPAWLETLTHDMPAMDRINGNPLFASLLPAYVASGSAAAARVARQGDFDVVHAFWPIPHGIMAMAAKRASKAALVSTFFSSELNWKGALRPAAARLLRRIVAASDAVTVISTYTANRLREYVPAIEAVTIPFGAAAASHVPAGLTTTRRAADAPFELLFVGRLVRRKGVDVLLRAVNRLRDDARLHLTIVGGGPELAPLKLLCAELELGPRVAFEGVVDQARVEGMFVRCDALILPAIVTESGETEGLGVVLIEAMGNGKPVIATSAGGITDIVQHGVTGLLAPPGDVQGLADAVMRMMDNPDESAAMARRGSAFAAEAFGWDAIISRLQEVYASAVKRRDWR
ncbi:MAG: glycosyltransferase [Gemmatimonadaceae bacterium]